MIKLSSKLEKIAQKMYKGRDSSHGIHHAVKVRNNAMLLSEKMNINDKNILIKIEAAALFHDLWDNKYVEYANNKYKDIKDTFYKNLRREYFSDHDIKDIEIIIDNISLSREIKFREENIEMNLKHLQLMRDIVSDADKLEMLGLNGINRIIEYQMYKFPKTKSEELKEIVKKVYDNKISKLIEYNYIRTEPAKEMARPLMNEMKAYIEITR
jgi:HD superfamily phosphodiesterase